MNEDKIIDCVDCSAPFTFTAAEQEFYASKNLSEPKRCQSCRTKRKAARGDGGAQQMHDATCSECGNPCQVPFEPNGAKPVYCIDCFRARNQK